MGSTTIQSAVATLRLKYRKSSTKKGGRQPKLWDIFAPHRNIFDCYKNILSGLDLLTMWAFTTESLICSTIVKDLWIKKGKKTPPLTIVLRVQKFFDQPLCCSLFLLNCPTVLSFYDAKPRPGLPSTSLKQHQHLNQCPLLNTLDHCRRPSGRIFGPRLPLFDHHRHCSIFPLQLHPTFLSAFNWVMIINWGCLKKTKKGQLTEKPFFCLNGQIIRSSDCGSSNFIFIVQSVCTVSVAICRAWLTTRLWMSGNKNTQETSNNKNINVDKMDATDQCCNSKVVNSAFCVKKNDESVC